MPEDISLLPKEVEKKKEQDARDRLWRRGGLVFLAISFLLTLGVFAYSLTLHSQLSNLEQDTASEMSKIASLSELELSAKDLEARVGALIRIINQKIYFSRLLTTLTKAVPAGVAVVELTVPSEEAISVSGTSRSYVSLAEFLSNLKEDGLFGAVELRSVSLDQQTGEANFDLNLSVVKEGLRK